MSGYCALQWKLFASTASQDGQTTPSSVYLRLMTLQLEAEITLKSCDARVCLHLLLESKIKPFFQSEFSILLILVFVQECSKRANYGKFTLRDLLVVPMQRVLKYHLLLQVLYSVLVHPRL